MANDRAIVIEVGKKSYVCQPGYGHQWEYAAINGRKDWPKAKGDERFTVVDGRVEKIELVFPPVKVVVKYELREALRGSALARWLTPAEHGQLKEADEALYEAVREERDQPPKLVQFDRIKSNVEPKQRVEGVAVAAPNHIDVYQWFWWTLPHIAPPQYVFRRLAERVKALDPEQFAVTIYDNIKHLRVEAHAINLGGVAYRPTGQLLTIDSDSREGKHCPTIKGDNLDDCLAKVEAWCDAQMGPIKAALTIKDCPCCGRPLKGKKAAVKGRDPARNRRVPQHDVR